MTTQTTETKATIGPWEAHTFMVIAPNTPHRGMYGGAQICHTGNQSDIRDPHECEANARLIAAAPELLAACVNALAFLVAEQQDVYAVQGNAVPMLKAAIAKAQGTTP